MNKYSRLHAAALLSALGTMNLGVSNTSTHKKSSNHLNKPPVNTSREQQRRLRQQAKKKKDLITGEF